MGKIKGWIIKNRHSDRPALMEGVFNGCACCDPEVRELVGRMLFATKEDAEPFLSNGQIIIRAEMDYERKTSKKSTTIL